MTRRARRNHSAWRGLLRLRPNRFYRGMISLGAIMLALGAFALAIGVLHLFGVYMASRHAK